MALLWVVAAFVFGAADQYLGSFSAHPLWSDISSLSAPWLVLPFVVGAAQRSSRRALVLGIACTLAALSGYMLMTLSPLENAHLSASGVAAFIRAGNYQWIAAGVITGPLFAWLGHKWRLQHVLVAGLVIGFMIGLEPVARHLYGNAIRHSQVAATESLAGVVVLLVMVWVQAVHKRPRGALA